MLASPRRRDYDRRVDDRDRSRERERDDDRGRSRRDNDWDRDRERERDRDRDRDRDRERERERERDRERRRGSPEYGDYKRPASPAPPPPNMYPNRPPRDGGYERDRPPHVRGGYGGGAGSDYLESRRAQRENSTISIWPPSPKAPVRAVSPERGSSRRKSKRDRSETPTESSDSESERRRRERKERKRARKEKERKDRKERKKHERRSRSYYDSDEEDRSRERDREHDRGRDRRSKSKSRPRTPSPSPPPSSAHASEGEEEWVEKPSAVPAYVAPSQSNGTMPPPATIPSHSRMQVDEDEDSDDEVGPQPLMKVNTSKRVDERAYGGALLRGEGSAMAAFLQDDTQSRIPRRGEIGLTSDEIAQFESVGYVMSGSRHKRMNAVRMRKENQVISAEEKRGILKLQKEERERREAILREEFSELVKEKLRAPEAKPVVT